MKHLIIVRYGDFDSNNGKLTNLGKDQISNIATQIKNLSLSENAVIVTSTAPRALQSSEIIQEVVSIKDCVKVEFLWSSPDDAPKLSYYHHRDPSKVMYIISHVSHQDLVILVSHYEVVNDFPRFFTKEIFGEELDCPKLEKGQALHIDIEKKQVKPLKNIDIVLEAKLRLLHNLLAITDPRPTLPDELIDYQKDYETFKAETEGLSDPLDSKYVASLRKFRDILIPQ